MNEALHWLARQGVTPLAPGRWWHAGVERSSNDLAHEWAAEALADDRLSLGRRLRLGFGLVDVLADYWATVELRWFITEHDDPALVDAFWAGVRRRLDGAEPCEQLLYSLWVDWFEDPATAESAFSAVLGDDVRALSARPAHRRTVRVLERSGPVPWEHKSDVYESVAAVPELWPALFKGLLAGYHDFYGDLVADEALALLDRLRLPPETEHLATLRAALRTGARNHYHDPAVWNGLLTAGP
ncbi:hypothetical protein ACQPZJ_24870 [Actinoplanes sp. CA-054009]